jgi:hypothetical protein
LPDRRLVLATGVSRGWRKFILESPTLRKKLFLEPCLDEPVYCRVVRTEPQISAYFPSGYLYIESDEEKKAETYEFFDMPDSEVERFYFMYGVNPPMATRFKLVSDCPLIELQNRYDDHRPAWEKRVRHINKHQTGKLAWMDREWLGDEGRNFRTHAELSGHWKQVYLTAPAVQRVVVSFKWAGENPTGVFKQVEGSRAVVRSGGIKCEDIYAGYMDVEGELTTYTRNPRVENEMVTYAGVTFDPGVDTQETPRTCLDNLAAAGFKMKQDPWTFGYRMSITGVVMPTPAEVATMKLPRELLEEDHMRLYAYQEFMLTTAEMRADGEDLAGDHYVESLPVEMVYPELCAQWEERVEQATMWKEKASRRWKR